MLLRGNEKEREDLNEFFFLLSRRGEFQGFFFPFLGFLRCFQMRAFCLSLGAKVLALVRYLWLGGFVERESCVLTG